MIARKIADSRGAAARICDLETCASIPDSATGAVCTAPLSLYINGAKQTDFTLTNAYSWYYGTYPFTNNPGNGAQRRDHSAGAGGSVWIPPGTSNIPGHLIVNDVTVAGTGMWHSTITGTAPGFYGNGTPTNTQPASTNVHLSNFAIFGNVQIRNDSAQVNGIGGAMSDSTVSDIWIEHMKVGAWMDGPMTSLTFTGMRIRDFTVDGLALWSDSTIGADSQDTISDDTVELQQLANGIAAYGGVSRRLC